MFKKWDYVKAKSKSVAEFWECREQDYVVSNGVDEAGLMQLSCGFQVPADSFEFVHNLEDPIYFVRPRHDLIIKRNVPCGEVSEVKYDGSSDDLALRVLGNRDFVGASAFEVVEIPVPTIETLSIELGDWVRIKDIPALADVIAAVGFPREGQVTGISINPDKATVGVELNFRGLWNGAFYDVVMKDVRELIK